MLKSIKKNRYLQSLFVGPILLKRCINHLRIRSACRARSLNFAVPLNNFRSSDRVYILGSGASINRIVSWETIARHDSIGFNFWPLHPFVPTHYFFEKPRCENNCSKLNKILSKRRVHYSDTKVFYKAFNPKGLASSPSFGGSKCVFSPINIPASSIESYARRLKTAGMIFANRAFLSEGNSSLESITSFCLYQGYKEIIICGVDLNHTNYFYEDDRNVEVSVLEYVPRSGQGNRSIHKTNDPREPRLGLTVEDSIRALLNVFEKHECNIYIESPNSALASFLPTWKH